MRYNYLVCGAGRQGTAVVYDLVQHCETKEVVVYEPSASAKDKARNHLAKILGPEVLREQKIVFINDLYDDNIQYADVMISCAPYTANVDLTRRAVKNRTHYCDLGGNPEVVAEQKKIVEEEQEQARDGVVCAVVPECGLSPGLTNIIAAHLAQKGATDIQVRCGGLPEWGDFLDGNIGGLNYKLVFSPEGLLSEYTGRVPILEDGELIFVDALGGHETMGIYECAYTSNNAPEVVETFRGLGVKNYDYKTMRYPGHWDVVRSWRELGLLHDDQSKNSLLLDTLKQSKQLQWDSTKDRDVVLLTVTGGKQEDLEETIWSYDIVVPYDEALGFSAMESSTSWGIAMVAHQLTHWDCMSFGHHFWTPEQYINSVLIIEGLNMRLQLLEDRNK